MTMEEMLRALKARDGGIYEEMAKFGEYFSSKYGISPSTALSVILGCVCLYMFVRYHWKSKKPTPPVLKRSISLAKLHGGELALRRLDEHMEAVAIPYILDRSDAVLKGLLEEEHLDFKKLQTIVGRLEMAGKEEEGAKILESALKKYDAQSHHRYEVEMLLVEMLIYQGNPQQALKIDCLNHREIEFDARRPLFKAIIHGMMGDWEASESAWKEFVEIREAILTNIGDPKEFDDRWNDFDNFKRKVVHLRDKHRRTSPASSKAKP